MQRTFRSTRSFNREALTNTIYFRVIKLIKASLISISIEPNTLYFAILKSTGKSN